MKRLIAMLLVLFLASCASERAYRDGMGLIEAGKIEEGLAKIEEASKLAPNDNTFRQAYFRQRDLAAQRFLSAAEAARQQGQFDAADENYRRVLTFDKQNARAIAGLSSVKAERRQRAQLSEAEDLLKKGNPTAAQAKVREVLAENGGNREAQALLRRLEERAIRAKIAGPQLSAALKKPITLEFRDASLRQVFDLVSRNAALNFIFDRDVRPDLRVTVSVRNSSIEDVLRFILVTNQLERKVLSEDTLLIFPNTAAKLREYQELVVKTFYLANSDAKTAASMIKTMVKTKDMHVDEKLNLVVMRDTPEAVRMAERLIANQDLAESEVLLELEVMEVTRNTLYNLGLQFPNQLSTSILGAAGVPGTFTLAEWQNRTPSLFNLTVTNPALILNLRNTIDAASLLANPRIRVRNKEKAKVHIGDKVPVVTTTSTATGFASQSVAYLDTGLKLEVEPQIYLEDDVGIKVALEVSNIVGQVTTAPGTVAYQIGTRNASTILRLKDGETQVLAGLINEIDQRTTNQIPGLGSLPVLGRLFGSTQDSRTKTEIVLLITPRVVRNIARPEMRYEEFLSGTEAVAGAAPLVFETATSLAPGASLTATVPASGNLAPSTATKVVLQAPPNIQAGGEFTVQVSLETESALKAGLLDFAFDPSRLAFVRAAPGSMLIAADKDAGFRINAPEALGRLNLNFASKMELKGAGELARITLRALGTAPGAPTLRIEALSFTTAAGQVVSAQLPPPVSLSLTP